MAAQKPFSRNFGQLRNLIATISGMEQQDVVKRKTALQLANCDLSCANTVKLANFGPQTLQKYDWVSTDQLARVAWVTLRGPYQCRR